MEKKDIEKLNNIANSFRRMSKKIKLISLLDKAKEVYAKNNNSECISICKKVLTKDSSNTVALRGIGCAMQSMGNFEQAVEYYLKALQVSETKEIEYTLLGALYYQLDNLDEAIKYFNLAIDINDNYEQAYEGRNQALLENHLKIIDLQDSLIKRNIRF